MGGYGYEMFEYLLNNLKNQTLQDFEIIVSDQSFDNKILDVAEKYKNIFDIKYIKNFYKKGISANNLNTCIDSSTGKIIKVLFQDDYFVDDNSLKKIYEKFNDTQCKWLMSGFIHTSDTINYFNTMMPEYNNMVLDGINSMGNPSNLSFLNSHKQYFDEDIIYLVDCEFYYRMNLLYGPPCILNEVLVAIRIHEVSATNDPKFTSKKDAEVNYCHNKYYDIING